MLTTQWRQRLRRFTTGRPASARRRRVQRQPFSLNAAAEVLESRELLTGGIAAGIPYLQWVQQPTNAIAGHALSSFTVDVMIQPKEAIAPRIDTAYTGFYLLTGNGPGPLVFPGNASNPPNPPLTQLSVYINQGVGTSHAQFDLAAFDVAGTYTLTATSPAEPGINAGIPGSAVSAKFTVTPDTATDHLVFVNLVSPIAAFPTSVTAEVVDQFGNIDTNVSNVPLTLWALPGTTTQATLEDGKATFNDVIFTSAGTDTLVAFGVGGPTGVLFAATNVNVTLLQLNS
jgi:hypothetical protein